MTFQEATLADIAQMQLVRYAVRENVLSDPAMVTDAHYEPYLMERGKGWICEVEGMVRGFAIADLQDNNIWALFVQPEYEGRGIGRRLHELMMDWYFGQGKEIAWLSTEAGTRAERFYYMAGWRKTGKYGLKEIKLEMRRIDWQMNKISCDGGDT